MSPSTVELPPPNEDVHLAGADPSGKRGKLQLELLEHCGLGVHDRVLEIGCGIGRLPYVLANWLEDDGSYTGFDISPPAIEWLKENYESRLPNFHFDLLDVHHPRFRPKGSGAADEIAFPYGDQQFDYACAFAVFMHLQRHQIENYLRELRRILRPGGRALVTLIVILPTDTDLKANVHDFVPQGDGLYATMPGNPKSGWAYDKALFDQMVADAGLAVADFIHGSWHKDIDLPPWPYAKPDTYVLTPA